MLEVKQHRQDSGHSTLLRSSSLPSCYPKVNEGDRAGKDIPCLTFSTSGDSQGRRGELHCTEITHTWCSSSLRSEPPHSLEGSWVSLHLYWKVNLDSGLWRKWWRTFAHSFLAVIKTLLMNQTFCYFVSVWETLNKTTQLSMQRYPQKPHGFGNQVKHRRKTWQLYAISQPEHR